MNIALILEMAADAAPDRCAVVCDGRRWTNLELLEAARGAAAVIRASGAKFVSLVDESSEAAAIALFGAALAAVPYCPLNFRLADDGLSALLGRIAPALVIGDPDQIARISRDQGHAAFSRADFIAAAQQDATSSADDGGADDGEIAVQLFTSGTTAAPKAAILRHANLLGYILNTIEFSSADEDEAALVVVPPYHIAGISALMSSLYAGRRIVMLPAFDPRDWLTLVEAEKVSNAFIVPTMMSRIVEELGDESNRVASLRAIAYGGGKMPGEVIRKALERFPSVSFTNAYGLTETSSTIALLGPEDHRAALESDDPGVQARLTSVGKPLPSVEIEIRDEQGRALQAGETGEIFVRGEQVSGEYRERSALTKDGWFPTRDAGFVDQDGYLFLSGRADDVIVRGGENISPGEIEDVLLTHPAIADACACAIPSVEWGEAIGIAVVTRAEHASPDAGELRDHIRARLRSTRVPEVVRFVDQLPYNEMGKLLRREVRAAMATG